MVPGAGIVNPVQALVRRRFGAILVYLCAYLLGQAHQKQHDTRYSYRHLKWGIQMKKRSEQEINAARFAWLSENLLSLNLTQRPDERTPRVEMVFKSARSGLDDGLWIRRKTLETAIDDAMRSENGNS